MNPIRIAALLAAGYFFYRQVAEGSDAETQTPQGGAQPPIIPQTPASPPAGQTQTPDPPAATNSELPSGDLADRYFNDSAFADQLHRLASLGYPDWVELANRIGVRFNVDQWNYIRRSAGRPPIDPTYMDRLLFGLDRSEEIPVTEFLSRLQSVGLGRIPNSFYRSWRVL